MSTNDYKLVELKPHFCRNKSFYGKANVVYSEDGYITLFSYCTAVCEITPDGAFHRTWGGYSKTTMKHVNDFLWQNNLYGGGAEWWREQPVFDAKHWFTPYGINYKATYY